MCNDGEPGGAESVDGGEAHASPEEARQQRPAARSVPRSAGGEAGDGGGQWVGDEIASRRSEDDAEPAGELGEDGYPDRSYEHIDRLRERPVAQPEQESGEDDRQNL